jgi:hypothetical protein
MKSHKDILLDLFLQLTDYTAKDVAWTNYSPALFAVEDFAMLRVMTKCGNYYSFSNDAGNFHLIKHEAKNE